MSLIKYSRPSTDLFSRRFNDIVDEMFNTNNGMNYRQDSFMSNVDIAESETQFEISAELPGLKKDAISIDLENGRLTISGERKFENEEEGKNYHRVESSYGTFTVRFIYRIALMKKPSTQHIPMVCSILPSKSKKRKSKDKLR